VKARDLIEAESAKQFIHRMVPIWKRLAPAGFSRHRKESAFRRFQLKHGTIALYVSPYRNGRNLWLANFEGFPGLNTYANWVTARPTEDVLRDFLGVIDRYRNTTETDQLQAQLLALK
jgi:hypothetical protein